MYQGLAVEIEYTKSEATGNDANISSPIPLMWYPMFNYKKQKITIMRKTYLEKNLQAESEVLLYFLQLCVQINPVSQNE